MRPPVGVADSHRGACRFVKRERMKGNSVLDDPVNVEPGLTSSRLRRILQVRIGHLSLTD